jgi:hypothetical protein
VRTIPDAIEYLKHVLNPPPTKAINSLESAFAGLELKQ